MKSLWTLQLYAPSMIYDPGCICLYLYFCMFISINYKNPSSLYYGYKTADFEKQHKHAIKAILAYIHHPFYRKNATADPVFGHLKLL